MNKKARVIAYYLPQFHPIPENDEWWGKGFTEWTNVAKAKPLFCGHYQPKIPADLGFYDLRLPEVREQQAELAKTAGIDAFCYWHYWFGNGKQLLEKPFQEVVKSGSPDFPFCVGWANHSWEKKEWNNDVSRFSKQLLIEQIYPNQKDVDDHFYTLLPAFLDDRYYRLHDKLVFVIFSIKNFKNLDYFIERWQKLAVENNLPGFYFIGHIIGMNSFNQNQNQLKQLDAINLHLLHDVMHVKKFNKLMSWVLKIPINTKSYKKVIDKMVCDIIKRDNVFPTIFPNWDTSPRKGVMGSILHGSTPELFEQHVKDVIDAISLKNEENKVIFLKSWNEWGEGNYMEPDLKFGKGYIYALKNALIEI
jgi:hypothetical protein